MKWSAAQKYSFLRIMVVAVLTTIFVYWSYEISTQAAKGTSISARQQSLAYVVVTKKTSPEEHGVVPVNSEQHNNVVSQIDESLAELEVLPVTQEQENIFKYSQGDEKHTYVEVVDSCGPYYEAECVNIRSGPGTGYGVVGQLRKGAVLKVVELQTGEDGRFWYKITFDEWLRYPERQRGTWYIAADFVRELKDAGEIHLGSDTPSSVKSVIIDRSEQMLYAYDGDSLFMEVTISTGRELAPTPRGNFSVFRMTPTRYMQGPIPGITDKEYDLPGVPWAIYFTAEGAAIHGAYWHDNFGMPWSNGCVNLPPELARKLYEWAELGMVVTVRD